MTSSSSSSSSSSSNGPDASLPSSMKIQVKNVYQPSEIETFDCDPKLSILQLKERIKTSLASAPPLESQKLIFGGKICQDQDILQNILAKTTNSDTSAEKEEADAQAFVFHLLLPVSFSKRSVSPTPSSSDIPNKPVTSTTNSFQSQTTVSSTRVSASASSRSVSAPSSAPTPGPSVPTSTPTAPPSDVPTTFIPVMGAPPSATSGNSFGFAAATPLSGVPSSWVPMTPPTPVPTSQSLPSSSLPSSMHFPSQMPPTDVLLVQQMCLYQQLRIQSELFFWYQLQRQVAVQQYATPPTASSTAASTGGRAASVFRRFFLAATGRNAAPPVAAVPRQAAPGAAGAPAAAAPAAAPPAPGPAAAPIPAREEDGILVALWREVLPLVDLRLILKMAFMLFIIGQDTPMDRVIMLSVFATIAFLQITGIFAKLFEIYKRFYGNPRNAGADGNGAGGAGAGAQGDAVPNLVDPADDDLFAMNVFRIAPDAGLLKDVQYFTYGLVLSLFPSWRPLAIGGEASAGGRAPNPVPDDQEERMI